MMTDERADELRALYNTHVVPTGRYGWKGPVKAKVTPALAADVAEAMNFIGSLVDSKHILKSGMVVLRSTGYWAHGF